MNTPFTYFKTCVLTALAVLHLLNMADAQVAPQFYVSTYTGGANNFPFNSASGNGSKCQWLFAPGQFKDAKSNSAYSGLITSIYVYAASGSGSHSYTSLKVELGHTTTSSLSSGTWHSGLQTCLSRNITLTGVASSSWVEIPLDKPFMYDPKKYMILSIENNGMSGGFTINQESKSWTARMYGDRSSSSSNGADAAQVVLGMDIKVPGPDNAGVVSIDSPTVFCGGTKAVYVTIGNYGSNQITEVDVNWEVDGVAQTTITYKGTLDTMGGKGKQEVQVYLGKVTFNTKRNILVYTSKPNGKTDKVTSNDSLQQGIGPSLGGTYTIGASGDFKTIKEAADDLSNFGVCAPVRFLVRQGTYSGQVMLNMVAGASSTNTISFISPSTDSATITHNSDATVGIVGTDYVSFEKFNIRATGTSGAAVFLSGGADYNRFSGCIIEASVSVTSSTLNPLVISSSATNVSGYGNNGNYNLFEDNDIRGGYYGVVMVGSSTSSMAEGNSFLRNTMTRSYYYGLRFYYVSGGKFHDNVIKDFRNSSNYGIYVYYISNFDWQRNAVLGTYYGNYFAYANYYNYKNTRSTFANNMLAGDNASYGLYAYYMHYTDFYHNSLYGQGSYLIYWYYMTGMDIRNNLFYYEGTSYAIYTYNPTVLAWDYNNYMIASGTLAYVSGSTYSSISSLAAWSSSYNQNNFDQDPKWIDKTKNHHLTKKFPELYGPYLGLTHDIDGDTRCQIMSTLGPDEFNGTTMPPRANFGMPDTAWVGSPTQILNAVAASKSLATEWYVNGKLASTDFHLIYTPKKTGKDEIKLVLMTCSGSDSLTKSLLVSTLIKRPVADFNASKTEVYTGETVNLIDLSQYGPTSHTWGIGPFWGKNPSTSVGERRFKYENGTDSTNAFPSVSFQHPGYYRVSLKAANKFGNSVKARNNFITVRQNAVMCAGPTSTTGIVGSLFDDGGKDGKYKAGTKVCYYTITSCEGTPVFSIKKFDLNSGDFLRVYDGVDATGKPLWDIVAFPKGITGGLSAGFATTFTAATGTAFVEFETDANTQTIGDGFEIEWYIKNTNWKSPNTNFDMADTACVGYEVAFESTTTGIFKTLMWDVYGDGSVDATGPTHAHTFTSAGTYKVALTAEGYCAKPASKTKKIVVINATKKPKPDFKANYTKASVGDTVKLTDLTRYCADFTKWEIKPPYYVLANNGNENDRNVEVLFGKSGVYTVKLTKGNSFGNDTMSRVRYIHVLDYCRPAVANLTTDLGISRVVFNTIDNRTEVGTEGYTYYQGISTTLDRGVKYPITIERTNTLQAMSRKVWIDWNMDGDFDDTGELVAEEKPSTTAVFTDSILISASATPGLTRMRVSTNYKEMKNLACGPHQFGEFEDYNVIISDKDRLAPSISLFGPTTDTIEVFTSWTEPGYKAYDILDGDLTKSVVVVNSLDTNKLGTYKVNYTVKDGGGNTDSAWRTIWVVDKTAPAIALIGLADTILQIHTDFMDPGVWATDNYDTSLQISVTNGVDQAVLGKYAIEYCATDLSGNGPTCVTRWVRVVDTMPPTIELKGNDVVQVEQCHYYYDQGYLASDDDRFTVTVGGTWTGSTQERGSFTVIYTVTDMAGNTASITRTIQVVDTESPVIEIKGTQVVYIDRWSEFTDPGTSVSDYCNEPSEVTVTTGGSFKNTQSNGLYTITYKAQDQSGNESPEIVRHIFVQQPLGINGLSAGGLSVFPNPTSGGQVWLGWQGRDATSIQISLTDVSGHIVKEVGQITLLHQETIPIDLGTIAQGTYFLHCQVDGYPLILPLLVK